MPITKTRDDSGQTRWQFEFSRRIGGQRVRTRKMLPASWTRTQADAYDRTESARLYALASGTEREQFTISQAVARYLDERVPDLKSGRGIAQELRTIQPWFDGHPLSALPDVCAKFVADNRAALAPATLRNRLRYLTSACRWGWEKHGMCEHDPAARVRMPAVANERRMWITRGEVLALAKACEHRPTRALIRIAFYSGMRLGEIERARVEDGCWVLDDTKNGEPRIVPMHPKCRAYADKYPWPTRFSAHRHFSAARALMGMEDLHFHDLRHSAATAMLKEGVHLFTVGAVLGHKSSASTKRYAHHATQTLREAVNQIGRRATSSPPAKTDAELKSA